MLPQHQNAKSADLLSEMRALSASDDRVAEAAFDRIILDERRPHTSFHPRSGTFSDFSSTIRPIGSTTLSPSTVVHENIRSNLEDHDACPSPVIRITYDSGHASRESLPQQNAHSRGRFRHLKQNPVHKFILDPVNVSLRPRRERQKTHRSTPTERPPAYDLDSDTDSVHYGWCHGNSMLDWKRIASTRLITRNPARLVNLRRRGTVRRHRLRPGLAVQRDRMKSFVRVTVPSRIRIGQRKAKSGFETLRNQAFKKENRKLKEKVNDSGLTVDLDSLDQNTHQPTMTKSPVPTLHDPVKDKCFSDECREFIARTGRKWDEPPPDDGFSSTRNGVVENRTVTTSKHSSLAQTVSSSQPTTTLRNSRLTIPPEPPERTSSRGGPQLATMLRMSKANCVPVMNNLRARQSGDALSACSSDVLGLSGPAGLNTDLRSIHGNSPTNLKHNRSFDTLAIIEAEVRHEPMPTPLLALTNASTNTIPSIRSNTPMSEPPVSNLPDVPIDDENFESCERQAQIIMPKRVKPKVSTIKRVIETPGPKGLGNRARDSLLHINSAIAKPKAISQIFVSPTSVYSQEFSVSAQGLHKALSRTKVLNAERSLKIEAAKRRHIAASPNLKSPGLRSSGDWTDDLPDELDRFPIVPHSRSNSGDSKNSKHSFDQQNRPALVPQSFDSANRQHGRTVLGPNHSRQSEKLSQSRIMVVVDTNPNHAYGFRAGDLSPAQSVSPQNSNSPVKENFPLSQTILPNTRIQPRQPENISSSPTSAKNKQPHKHRALRSIDSEGQTLRQTLAQIASPNARSNKSRIIIESSDDDENLTPLVQSPAPPTSSKIWRSMSRSSRASSTATSLFSITDEKQRWKEFCRTAKQDHEEWRQLRNLMKQDLENLFKDLKTTNVVLGRMAHVGRGLAKVDEWDDSDEYESLLSRESVVYSHPGSAARSSRSRQRTVGKAPSRSNLRNNATNEYRPNTGEKLQVKGSAYPGERPITNGSGQICAETATDSDGSALLSGSSKDGKKSLSDASFTDPQDYEYDSGRDQKGQVKRSTKYLHHVSGDQTVSKAASLATIRRVAREEADDRSPMPQYLTTKLSDKRSASSLPSSATSAHTSRALSSHPPDKCLSSSPVAWLKYQHELDQKRRSDMFSEASMASTEIELSRGDIETTEEMDQAIETFKVYI